MAHADQIKTAITYYENRFNSIKEWKKHVKFLYAHREKNRELFGRLCLSQNARFIFKLKILNDGYIHVFFWREDPNKIGTLIDNNLFSFRLGVAFNVFPELETAFISENEDEIFGFPVTTEKVEILNEQKYKKT